MKTYKDVIEEEEKTQEFSDQVIYTYLNGLETAEGDLLFDAPPDERAVSAMLLYAAVLRMNTEAGADSETAMRYAVKVVREYLRH